MSQLSLPGQKPVSDWMTAYSEPRTSEVLICGFATTRSEPVAFCKYVSTSSLTSGCPRAELAEPLTPRESEVLQMVASGLANEEI